MKNVEQISTIIATRNNYTTFVSLRKSIALKWINICMEGAFHGTLIKRTIWKLKERETRDLPIYLNVPFLIDTAVIYFEHTFFYQCMHGLLLYRVYIFHFQQIIMQNISFYLINDINNGNSENVMHRPIQCVWLNDLRCILFFIISQYNYSI